MTKLLPQETIDENMLILNGWIQENNDIGQITKEYEFENFEKAINFINKVAKISIQQNQHPDILLHSKKNIELMITNYEYEGITQECLDLAFAIDGIE